MNRIVLTIVALIVSIISCRNNRYFEVNYYVPVDYEGVVLLVYSQKNCKYISSKDYIFPKSGILKISNDPNHGPHTTNFYLVDSLGNKRKIEFVFVDEIKANDLMSEKIVAYKEERGKFVSKESKNEIVFDLFFVSKIKNIKKYGWAEREKISLIESIPCE